MRFAYPFAFLALLAAPLALAADYEIDTAHSSVSFRIRHLVAKTTGKFTDFGGAFSYEKGNPKTWKAEATIVAASIDTDNKKRDAHLRGADFFEVAKYPKIVFKSDQVADVSGDKAKLHGALTMHGVTKPVVLDVEFTGAATDPWGNKKIGFSARGKLDRKDYGIVWNETLKAADSALLGDEVELMIEIEGTEKAEAAKKAKK